METTQTAFPPPPGHNMARTKGYLTFLWVIVLGAGLLFRGCTPFEQKTEDVCHSLYECGNAQLTCDSDKRLALISISHAHHLNVTTFAECPQSVNNCSAVPSSCCSPPTGVSEIDCTEKYPLSSRLLREAHGNCSARISSQGPVVCDLELPTSPQPSRASCLRLNPLYQDLSSYSTVKYSCVNETDVAQLCTASQRTGNLLYTLWLGGGELSVPNVPTNNNQSNSMSCRCTITPAASGSAALLFIRAVDVRIRNSAATATGVNGNCSYVTVSEQGRTRLTTSCATDTEMFFEGTSPDSKLIDITTPADVILTLSVTNPPEIVWFGIMGLNEEDITLTCYDAALTPDQEKPKTGDKDVAVDDDDDGSSAVIAAVASAAVGIVILVMIGFICCYMASKKRKHTHNIHKRVSKTWWDEIREEDRIANLSQLGAASRVIIDTGRNVQYGKRPVYKTYETTDTNPPIYVVPGSAFSQPPPPPSDVDFGTTSEGAEGGQQYNHHGESSGAEAMPEPLVFYSASSGSGEVLFLHPETLPPVKKYNIPPLTIKELED